MPPATPDDAGTATAETREPPAARADADSDGPSESMDFCPGSPPGSRVDAFGCTDMETIVLRGVSFQADSARLTDESRPVLDNVAAILVAHPEIHVEVAGHTANDGDAEHNVDLSARRAIVIMKYLADAGVSPDNLIARGYGAERPIAPDDTPEGKAANRRIELSPLD
jgi:OOP family OmpA-OmpF porin